jgi:hypothetical protein
VFDEVVRSPSRLPEPVSFQSPLQTSQWHIPSETGSDTSTARSAHPEQQPHTNMDDFSGRGDCCHGREFFSPARGCDARTSNQPLDPPSALSPSFATGPRNAIDPLSPGTTAYPVIFTDDAKMKLGGRIRRQCFNCRTTATKTWRRSVLSSGKMVCLV